MRVLAILICSLCTMSLAYAADYRVPTDVSTIQAGLDVAVNGDTVTVADGTYRWLNNNELRFHGKSILLRSENGPDNCTLEPEPNNRALVFDGGEGPESVVDGFTIQYARSSWGAILIENSSPTIKNCLFYRNYSYGYGGAVSVYDASPSFEGCRFLENSAKDGGGAFYSKLSTFAIDGCNFWANSQWRPEGWTYNSTGHIIYADTGSVISIEHSELGATNHRELPGILAVHSELEIMYGTLFGCVIELSVGNVSLTNTIVQILGSYSIVSWNDSGTVNMSCCLLYGADKLGLESIRVPTLIESQNSIGNPLFCDPLNNVFMLMEGSPALAENNSCGVQIGSLTEGCQPEHRVINVKPDGTGDVPTIQDAINLAMHYDTVLLHDGVFRGVGNRDIVFRGRRVVVRSVNGPEATIIDCEGVRGDGHRAFDFAYGEDDLSKVQGVTFKNGFVAGAGGAVFCFFGNPSFDECAFISNEAWGSSRNDGGAIWAWPSNLKLENCLFSGNIAGNGGALWLTGATSRTRITNCTFVGNSATLHGSAINISGDSTTSEIENCIIAFNNNSYPYDTVGALYCWPGHPLRVTCTNIFGNEDGDWVESIADQAGVNGNMSENPLFCDTITSNYYLSEFSPCAPENNSCGELIGALDVGCIVTDVENGEVAQQMPSEYVLSQNYPNPFNPTTTISYTLPEGTEVNLSIYNVLGQDVKQLVKGFVSAGEHIAEWDGTDREGVSVASGVYFYKLQVKGKADTRKMILLR